MLNGGGDEGGGGGGGGVGVEDTSSRVYTAESVVRVPLLTNCLVDTNRGDTCEGAVCLRVAPSEGGVAGGEGRWTGGALFLLTGSLSP